MRQQVLEALVSYSTNGESKVIDSGTEPRMFSPGVERGTPRAIAKGEWLAGLDAWLVLLEHLGTTEGSEQPRSGLAR